MLFRETVAPSSPPSRAIGQALTAGAGVDVVAAVGRDVTKSYGFVFNVRTKPRTPPALLTGIDFLTDSTGGVRLEVWTRPGSFEGHRGTRDGWTPIAIGRTRGLGVGAFTPVPPGLFTPVRIPGDGGTRALYITLDSNHLIYRAIDDAEIGESDAKVGVLSHWIFRHLHRALSSV
jgi:hypothetical protein